MRCPNCEYESDKLISLSLHFRKIHKESAKCLRIQLFHDGKHPTCECGCGEETKFHSVDKGFSSYVRGHQMRVHNNWGHNEQAQSKSQQVRREMHSRGEIKIWNKGETKETDEKIAAYGRKQSQNTSEERKQRRSESMKKHRLNGSIPTPRGAEHGRWRGGTSALAPLCRSRLYRDWSFPKMISAGFKCSMCGAQGRLEVHHDVERFADIMQKGMTTLGEPGEDFDRKACFADWVLWYHTTNNVSGIVLCESCHAAIHDHTPASVAL